ncbi:folate-binding protein YgfZ [Gordonia sp. PDNC005]|uniref:CAF17-like 4Fe-4S cluster assembly/insertion protein YgfZ n=1 Tax=unclassified Gordonia (in: high G+C Gram-positive bacteria) TaxID=2657482 RepID=UPI001966A521|nr:folate-binding protein YgfZ [Gordonia sp. PDNC005]QRY62980.1 folate-binding protein YgfZ [Gordonia sp. PDNC005]
MSADSSRPVSSAILAASVDAVPTPDGDLSPGVAWHYGDPLGEQRSASRGVVVVDRSDRSVIELAGPERLTWLHTISSQHVSALPDRRSAENLSLDLNGRVEDHFVITDINDVTWVDTEQFRGAALADFLTKMVFWAQVTPAARADMAVLTLIGPAARTGAVAELLEIPSDADVYAAGDLPERHHDEEPLGFWRVMPPIGEGRTTPVVDVVVPRDDLAAWWTEITGAGAQPAGMWTYDALRVAAGRARLGIDTDDRTIPHEADWIGGPDQQGAVHLEKGCYRGQETVSRVANIGRAPRRLVLLHLDGATDARPATGDPVSVGGRSVGRIGTVIDHYELGPIALALVKRAVPVDADLVAGAPEVGTAARIDDDLFVPDDAVPAGRAAQDRLRGRS